MRWIIIPKGSDGTPAEWKVVGILVRKANGLWPKIEGGARENAVGEVLAEARIAGEEAPESFVKILVDAWGPDGKGSSIGSQ